MAIPIATARQRAMIELGSGMAISNPM